jgi:hypothetical protein
MGNNLGLGSLTDVLSAPGPACGRRAFIEPNQVSGVLGVPDHRQGGSAMDERKSAERRASNAARDTATRAGENAREAADRLQESSSKAAEGFREYQLKVLSAAQANVNAIFECAQDMIQAQSMSELLELSATHSRRQLETLAQQSREIASAAQKLAGETAEPLTGGFGSKFSPMS